MKHLSTPLLLLLAAPTIALAQQPFAHLGVEVKVLTLTAGRYPEFFAHDSLRRIGSVVYDTRRQRIAALLPTDSVAARIGNDVPTRWLSVDPLAHKFAGISPYVFSINNPIAINDPDGRKPRVSVSNDGGGNTIIEVTNTVIVIAKNDAEKQSLMATFSQVNNYLPTHTWDNKDGKTTTLSFKTTVLYAKDKNELKALEAQAALQGGAFVEAQQSGHGEDADYTAAGGTDAKDIDVLVFGAKSSGKIIAHELGHDLGFADKYVEMGDGYAAVLEGYLNTLMGQLSPLSEAEAKTIAENILRRQVPGKGIESCSGIYYPIDMKGDFPVKVGDVVNAHMPVPAPGKGVDEHKTSKVKITGGNEQGSKTLTANPN